MPLRGGYRLPLLSVRATWRRVDVQAGHQKVLARTGIPLPIQVYGAEVTIQCNAQGFIPSQLSLSHGSPAERIVRIVPDITCASPSAPLGRLVIEEVSDAGQLGPYLFYRSLPTSIGRRGLTGSVLVSIALSVALASFGLAPLVAAIVVLGRSVAVSVILLILFGLMAPLIVPGGLGGVILGVRFLRLPRSWRHPHLG